MTDRKLIFDYLDKYYVISMVDVCVSYNIIDREENTAYNLHRFCDIFFKIFGDYPSDEENISSFDMMMEWYRERAKGVDRTYSRINFLNKERFNELLNYKSVKKTKV